MLGLPAAPAAPARVTVSPPLTLYVHLPWCLRKCPYCDFNSHEYRPPAAAGIVIALVDTRDAAAAGAVAASAASAASAARAASAAAAAKPAVPAAALPREAEQRYLQALRADLEGALPLIWGRPIHAVFFGGGTPSLFSAGAIEELMAMIRSLTRLSADAEITLEANPGTFERDKFRAFRAAGINRLSIGVQSFDDARLAALGRVHGAREAFAAIDLAAQIFDSYNIDLMYGLPGQDLAALERELDQVARFAPPHLSYYNLTLEPNTVFAKFPPALPDEDTVSRMQDRILERAKELGLRQYEVSAYARQGHRARHNLNYWQFGDYLGIGAGAHSKLSFHDRIVRQARFSPPESYQQAALSGHPVHEEHGLRNADIGFEFMLNALRLRDGVPVGLFAERTGLPIAFLSRPIARALEKGLLDPDPTLLKASALGFRFLNDLQALFLADD